MTYRYVVITVTINGVTYVICLLRLLGCLFPKKFPREAHTFANVARDMLGVKAVAGDMTGKHADYKRELRNLSQAIGRAVEDRGKPKKPVGGQGRGNG